MIEQVLLDPRAVHVRLLLPLDEVLEAAGQGRQGGRGRTRAEHRLHLFPAFDVVLERRLVVPAGGSRGGWRTFPRVFAHRDVVPDDAASREEYAPVRGAEDPRVAGDPHRFLRRVRRRHHRQPAGSPHRGRRRRGNREAVLHLHGSLLIRRLLIRVIRLVRLANPALALRRQCRARESVSGLGRRLVAAARRRRARRHLGVRANRRRVRPAALSHLRGDRRVGHVRLVGLPREVVKVEPRRRVRRLSSSVHRRLLVHRVGPLVASVDAVDVHHLLVNAELFVVTLGGALLR